jgi:hypothetical protein
MRQHENTNGYVQFQLVYMYLIRECGMLCKSVGGNCHYDITRASHDFVS